MMTTLFLSSLGGTIGNNFGPIGRFVGSEVGTYVGAKIDNFIIGASNTTPAIKRSKIGNINIQTSTYGKVIPTVYGHAKLSGNIIWARPIQEVLEEGHSNKWGFSTELKPSYAYYITFAIAICTGVVNKLLNIYANEQAIDNNAIQYRFYAGTEEQEPDYLINELESNTTAYRGISYIVFEDFPLAEYGNLIPNFTFEISANISPKVKIKGVNIIPGSGEFVYDTKIQSKSCGEFINKKWIQIGQSNRINQNSKKNTADALVSLTNIQETFPNLEWVSVIINWFCDSLNIADCKIYPAVEYKKGAKSIPDDWQVSNITRQKARLITYNSDSPIYGGTVSDNAYIRYIKELKKSGYKVLIYPMLLLDMLDKPWRGHMQGSAQNIPKFFAEYTPFIEHYARLTKGLADAFIIGSELKGITQINQNGHYPAVKALCNLAQSIKNIVGSSTKITYAADWSEYHSHNGQYYLDELWSSPDIDIVGIDAYFPLTDSAQPILGFSQNDIIKGWCSGEGYEYYYKDYEHHTGKTAFDEQKWAWKNIRKWWEEEHIGANNIKSKWQAKMKKIWFIEYGFPSVNACSNQPNVFIDKTSKESKLPFHSNGNIDFRAQSVAIEGTVKKWHNSEMIENMFLWAWDARPFPYFPYSLNIWKDGEAWKTGHWVQGKICLPQLGNIISSILKKIGYKENEFDCKALTQPIEGIIINEHNTARSIIEALQQCYFFDIINKDNQLIFQHQASTIKLSLTQDDLIPINDIAFEINRSDSNIIPSKVELIYLNKARNYEICSEYSERNNNKQQNVYTIFVPIIMDSYYAKTACDILLYTFWKKQISYSLNLPSNLIDSLSPADIIQVTLNNQKHIVKIHNIDYGQVLHINGVAHDNSIYCSGSNQMITPSVQHKVFPGNTEVILLDLPTNSEGINVVKNGVELGWNGATLYALDHSNSYHPIKNLYGNTTQGTTLNALANGPVSIIDKNSELIILLQHGKLENITEEALFDGGNLALIGDEIVQFRNAELISEYKYKLSNFIRGRYSTEDLVNTHHIGEKFILLNNLATSLKMLDNMIDKKLSYKVLSHGQIEGTDFTFIYKNNYLRPFSVVHISGIVDSFGNIIISWNRRSRIDSDLLDYIEVPLAEEYEKYYIEIYKHDEVIRTYNIQDKTSCIYSADLQKKDFGKSQSSLDLCIYQLSITVGRGYASKQHIQINIMI